MTDKLIHTYINTMSDEMIHTLIDGRIAWGYQQIIDRKVDGQIHTWISVRIHRER